MLKTLERVAQQIDVEEEEGLFGGPDDPLRVLADRLAEAILLEPELPLRAIKVARADLPEGECEQLQIGFYLKLACGPKDAFKWLDRLSYRQYEIDQSLAEEERQLFARTFNVGINWEKRE